MKYVIVLLIIATMIFSACTTSTQLEDYIVVDEETNEETQTTEEETQDVTEEIQETEYETINQEDIQDYETEEEIMPELIDENEELDIGEMI